MLEKKKFFIGGAIVILAISYLVYAGFASSATYFYTVSEFREQESSDFGDIVRVNGEVIPGSIEKDASSPRITFTLAEADETLVVVYEGIVPDTFKDDADIVVEGQFDADGTFKAHTLMAKCASKYEPTE